MAGIINYFHGESGISANIHWRLTPDVRLVMVLDGDPHRTQAFDYGADVSFDPMIRAGDQVTYVRLDDKCGAWVRQKDIEDHSLYRSLRRVRKNRLLMYQITDSLKNTSRPLETIAAELSAATSLPVELVIGNDNLPADNSPSTEISLFLSYSSRNVLLARQLFSDLRTDAKAEIWFDLNQGDDQPQHMVHAESWLRSAVFNCRGMILLMSKAAAESSWVRRELNWAEEAAKNEPNFHIVVLNIDDIRLSFPSAPHTSTIDCLGLTKSVGIPEELFAAIYRRVGRRKCLADTRFQGLLIADKDGWEREDLESDTGIAVELSWTMDWVTGVKWKLRYQRNSREESVEGAGLEAPVDLDIKPGDLVGWYICHRRDHVRYGHGVKLVMRSNDLMVTPDSVLDEYYKRTFTECPHLKYQLGNVAVQDECEDSFGRSITSIFCKCPDGKTRRMEQVQFYGTSEPDDGETDPGLRAKKAAERLFVKKHFGRAAK